MSGAREASPMEGVTGTVAWLSQVPGCSRAGLYGPANIGFRLSDVVGSYRPNNGALRGPIFNGPRNHA